MTWIDIEQNTEEWFKLRSGKITGSALQDIMRNYPKAWGNPGKNRARKVAAERMKGGPLQERHYSNKHMERGRKQEPDALFLYYDQTGMIPSNGGFYDLGNLGVSPDGRVIEEGGIVEVKSVIASTHFKLFEKEGPDTVYKWQYTLELKAAHEVDGFEWLDFVSYCADFPPDKQLHISRINVSDKEVQEDFRKIDDRIEQFEKEVQRLIDLV